MEVSWTHRVTNICMYGWSPYFRCNTSFSKATFDQKQGACSVRINVLRAPGGAVSLLTSEVKTEKMTVQV